VAKSGGLATNIGVHLFDLAACLYGKFLYNTLSVVTEREMAGNLELQSASVSWRLSIKMGETPKRMFNIDGVDYDLTTGFNDLHTKVYQEVLAAMYSSGVMAAISRSISSGSFMGIFFM